MFRSGRHSSNLVFLGLFLCAKVFGISDLDRYEGKVRVGFELELLPANLKHILHLFSVPEPSLLRVRHHLNLLTDESLNDHLETWEQFEKLPMPLQERLSEGLEYTFPKIASPETKKPENRAPTFDSPSSLLGPDGKPLLPVPALTPTQSLILPKLRETAQKTQDTQAIQHLSNQFAFSTIQAKWRALSRDEKLSAITFESLSSEQKIPIYLSSASGSNFKLREGAPPAVQELFSRLTWHLDGDALEFKYKSKDGIESPAQMEADLSLLARLSLATKELNFTDPASRGGASYHLHVSVPNRNLEFIGESLNLLTLLRLMETGRMNLFHGYGYPNFVFIRGDNHIEVRLHTKEMGEGLRNILDLVTTDEGKALESLWAEINSLLTDERFKLILERAPAGIASLLARELTHAKEHKNSAVLETCRKQLKGEPVAVPLVERVVHQSSSRALADFINENISEKFLQQTQESNLETLLRISHVLATHQIDNSIASLSNVLNHFDKGIENRDLSKAEYLDFFNTLSMTHHSSVYKQEETPEKKVLRDYFWKLHGRYMSQKKKEMDRDLENGQLTDIAGHLNSAFNARERLSFLHRDSLSHEQIRREQSEIVGYLTTKLDKAKMVELLTVSHASFVPFLQGIFESGDHAFLQGLLPSNIEEHLLRNIHRLPEDVSLLSAYFDLCSDPYFKQMRRFKAALNDSITHAVRKMGERGEFGLLSALPDSRVHFSYQNMAPGLIGLPPHLERQMNGYGELSEVVRQYKLKQVVRVDLGGEMERDAPALPHCSSLKQVAEIVEVSSSPNLERN